MASKQVRIRITRPKPVKAEASLVEADTLGNVLMLTQEVFGSGGQLTRNFALKEAVLPLKSVVADKIREFTAALRGKGWGKLSFSKYVNSDSHQHLSLTLFRRDPDHSGFNGVTISTETNVSVFHLFTEDRLRKSRSPDVAKVLHQQPPEDKLQLEKSRRAFWGLVLSKVAKDADLSMSSAKILELALKEAPTYLGYKELFDNQEAAKESLRSFIFGKDRQALKDVLRVRTSVRKYQFLTRASSNQ